jgi:parvulin-like peptidyl-prolyl isomerase
MKTLSQTWFADGYIDFELKKYTLLAYLQEIGRHFTEHKLYPQLADLIFHYNNIVAFRENKKYLQEQFPKKLTGIQLEKLQLLYESLIEDDELMQELEDIINYASTTMKKTITTGSEIYEFVENKINIEPVGIMPLDQNEGYFLLCEGSCHNTWVYQYRLSIFEKHDEKYRSIKTEFVDVWQRNFVNTYSNIKSQLLRNRSDLPNPAVYAVETDLTIPMEETLLPIAKRSLVRYITNQSA